jgi:hypothetical protein
MASRRARADLDIEFSGHFREMRRELRHRAPGSATHFQGRTGLKNRLPSGWGEVDAEDAGIIPAADSLHARRRSPRASIQLRMVA